MTFDGGLYDQLVWKPVSRGRRAVPANLWVLVGWPDPERDPSAHLKEMEAFWRKANKGRDQQLVATVQKRYRDEQSEGGSIPPDALTKARSAALAEAGRRVDGLKATTSALSKEGLTKMAADLVLPEPHLTPLLDKASIKVVDAPELPVEPGGYGRFQTGTKLTEHSTLAQLYAGAGPVSFTIIGGLRVLPPAAPIDQQVAKVDDEQRKMGPSFGRLEKATFDLIKKAIGDGNYGDFLYFELVTKARELKRQAVGQRQIAQDLVGLGLAGAEAELISAAVIQDDAAAAADPDSDLAAELAEMLQEGRLRHAQRHLTADHERSSNEALKSIAGRIKAQLDQLDALVARADAAAPSEDAAVALAEATNLCKDDPNLASRLAALPPPPPGRGQVVLRSDDTALAKWQASPARVGKISYVVVRHTSRPTSVTDGVKLGEVDGLESIDTGIPTAQVTYYAVAARRDGGTPSDLCQLGSLFSSPDVSGLQHSTDASSVSAHWQAPERAVAIKITKRTDRPPNRSGDGDDVPAESMHGFVDCSVSTGTVYHYLVSVVYRGGDGALLTTDGVGFSARPQREATPITDLALGSATSQEGDEVELAWTSADPTADVRILRSPVDPRLTIGQRVGLDRVRQLGTLFSGSTRPDGSGTARLKLASGTNYFTAILFGYDAAMAGNTLQTTNIMPVRGLRAERLQEYCQLQWVWPESASSAVVRHWPSSGKPADAVEVEISRRHYEDEGVRLSIGRSAVEIQVQVCAAGPNGLERSMPKSCTLSGLSQMVTYGLRRKRFSKQALLWFKSSDEIEIPAISVIWTRDRIIPSKPGDGSVLTTIADIKLGGLQEHEVPIDLRDVPKEAMWLACFTDRADIDLRPEGREQLRMGK